MAMGLGVWAFHVNQHDFKTLDGQSHSWSDYKGQWVVVNYFAEWCAPCLKEIPELNAFADYASSANNVSLFAISYDSLSPEALQKLKDQYNMEFALIDSREPQMLNPMPKNLPATFIISPAGEVKKRLLGEQTNESLQQIIAALEVL